jgi:hypothetical protein
MSATATKYGQSRTVQAHHAETTVEGNGVIRLDGLPFPEGTVVEVIVLEGPDGVRTSADELRGSVLKDDAPFDPAVAPEDWKASA